VFIDTGRLWEVANLVAFWRVGMQSVAAVWRDPVEQGCVSEWWAQWFEDDETCQMF
jgi:hypothetical protein